MKAFRQFRPACRRGFTLVELLVVIAILSLLLALLMPTLKGAKDAALQAQCLSNVRGLYSAHMQYIEQNNGMSCSPYAQWIQPDGTLNGRFWRNAFFYAKLMPDPGMIGVTMISQGGHTRYAGGWGCPASAGGTWQPDSTASYSYGYALSHVDILEQFPYWWHHPEYAAGNPVITSAGVTIGSQSYNGYILLARLTRPTSTIMSEENNSWHTRRVDYDHPDVGYNIHAKGFGTKLWYDGHATAKTYLQMYPNNNYGYFYYGDPKILD